MDHHLGILQQRVQPRAVGRDRPRSDGKRWRGDHRAKRRRPGSPARITDAKAVRRTSMRGACGTTKPYAPSSHAHSSSEPSCPLHMRGKFIRRIERDVAMRADVLHGKVVGQRRPHQGKGRAAQRNEAGDSGAAGRLAQAVPAGLGNAGRAQPARRRAPQRKASDGKVIEGENERQQQAEASELRHGVKAHRPFIVSNIRPGM